MGTVEEIEFVGGADDGQRAEIQFPCWEVVLPRVCWPGVFDPAAQRLTYLRTEERTDDGVWIDRLDW